MNIKRIKKITLEEPTPVCDLTVDNCHNYRLACGVYAHNSHIECLLLGFFLKHMRPLIEQGRIYIGLPPLYRITERGKHTYLRDEDALKDFYRSRAIGTVSDKAVFAIAGEAPKINTMIAAAAATVGASPGDISHALSVLVRNEKLQKPYKNQLPDFAEAILASRETDCEGITAKEILVGEQFVISGLTEENRFFTTVITEGFLETTIGLLEDLVQLVSKKTLCTLLNSNARSVANKKCKHLQEYVQAIETEIRRGTVLQRIKGLGEMNDDELGSTTLDANTRRLIQINVTDFNDTGEFVSSMLSKSTVEARRQIIEETMIERDEVDA
jgi:DNA gyrase subunit B